MKPELLFKVSLAASGGVPAAYDSVRSGRSVDAFKRYGGDEFSDSAEEPEQIPGGDNNDGAGSEDEGEKKGEDGAEAED